MRTATFFLSLSLPLCLFAASVDAAPQSAGGNKAVANQGLTLDEIGKGLKSAAKNIEEEIPQIGPAISKTFKQVSGDGNKTSTSQDAPQGSTLKK